MRYHQQGFELPVTHPDPFADGDLRASLAERFVAAHGLHYGFELELEPELVVVRCVATGLTPSPAVHASPRRRHPVEDAVVDGDHTVYWDGGWIAGPVYARERLGPGHRIAGPAVIEQEDSTTLVHPGLRRERRPVPQPGPATGGRVTVPAPPVDTVTLEIIENTLRMVRHEMDAVMFRASISPMIRETHDTYPLVADRNGRMLVGQFGSYLTAFFEHFDEELGPGDVIIQNDPYLCGGSSRTRRTCSSCARSSTRASSSASRASSETCSTSVGGHSGR